MPDLKNINLGAGTLYAVDYDKTVDPHNTETPPAWAEVGFIADGGVILKYSKEYKKVKTEKYLAAAKTFVIGEKANLEMNLLESHLANIVTALGLPSTVISNDATNKIKTVKIGNDNTVQRLSLKFVAKTEDGAETQTIFCYNVVLESEFELKFAREDERTLKSTFEMYPSEFVGLEGKLFGIEETYTV